LDSVGDFGKADSPKLPRYGQTPVGCESTLDDYRQRLVNP
jgi:hypothetical protein